MPLFYQTSERPDLDIFAKIRENRDIMAAMKQNRSPERSMEVSSSSEHGNVVFQPTKLNEVMEMINFMGNISEKVTEHHALFTGSSGASTGDQKSQGSSQRDQILQKLPPTAQMQKKLVKHIDAEIASLEKKAKRITRMKRRGWAFELTLVIAHIHRLAAIAREIMRASLEVVRRFYILVFIDHQPLVPTSGVGSAQPA
jgi:hypothetical protein